MKFYTMSIETGITARGWAESALDFAYTATESFDSETEDQDDATLCTVYAANPDFGNREFAAKIWAASQETDDQAHDRRVIPRGELATFLRDYVEITTPGAYDEEDPDGRYEDIGETDTRERGDL